MTRHVRHCVSRNLPNVSCVLSLTPSVTDECDLGIDTCDPNAECVDLTEGFVCACNLGFAGDGVLCLSK